ncbi:alpha-1,6-mannosylglycoprotein 6-beta-N-acetylglucosaminyltransferase A-like [Dendronephthya gigantea]|uniref:alpha-1,6-mannosylglycoprotein 6-beta-N-acetylglucosaminyltransferase A-like n=1 Tax=Dendronephthya gigantea TaxID=151771 RepID=UPI00106C99D4|nr:alpha-1,6-mannosylglycoprotein 6-beta-N-acetylglucosaminyltransferase A-like [Dendronephthya gigantea]XP_028398469.1 alpha-1,6-mannosylglycoprotein 6-beta-N-acetylglucosaminyltransferase A-like [Dendronephthya gigantea]
MVSLRLIYQLILVVWFGSLIFIFSHITELGYPEPIAITTEDVDQNLYGPIYDFSNQTIERTANEVKTNSDEVTSSEELPLETLQCPLPEPSRAYPFCQEHVVELWDHGDQHCYKRFGVDKSDDCSVLSYLSEVERWCPLLPGRNITSRNQSKPVKAKLRKDIKGLFKILKYSYYKWTRNRLSSWWREWTAAVQAITKRHKQTKRMKKKILVFLGSFADVPTFFYAATSGGPLGELVQWTDLIASIYLLGHDLTVSAATKNLPRLLGQPDSEDCIPEENARAASKFDIIFTDIVGVGLIKNLTRPLFSKYKCRLRVVDSFGTDAEFNHRGYRKHIPGGGSYWGKLDLDLRQFMTMFPHSPDNTFLGFVSGVKVNATESKRILAKKRDQCLVYGRVLEYWRGHSKYLQLLKQYVSVHATTIRVNSAGKETERVKMPGYVKNHGIVGRDALMHLLQQSKIFVGLGFPYEGPAPLEAIANGAVFLNPKFKVPKNRTNSKFFRGKPTSRSLTSQSPYLEEFVGKPYVYTVDIKNLTEINETLKVILKKKVPPFLPLEYTCKGMLERVDALIANQDFCDGKLWPPLDRLKIVLGQRGDSCKEACVKHGRVCEPAYWEVINQKAFLKKLRKCETFESESVLHAPSFNGKNSVCYLQENVMLFSCVAKQRTLQRLCPCRGYRKEQVALCEGCY